MNNDQARAKVVARKKGSAKKAAPKKPLVLAPKAKPVGVFADPGLGHDKVREQVHAAAKKDTAPRKKHKGLLSKVADAAGEVAETTSHVVHTVYPHGKKGGKGTGSAAVSSVPMVATGGPANRARNIGLAIGDDTVHGRVDTLKNTVRSVPSTAAGVVGSVGSIVNDAAHGRATTLKKLPGETAKDYKRRYGASQKDQIRQIQQEGALPDFADATIVVGGTGAVAGRVLSKVAETGGLGERAARVATEARPKLRVTPGEGGAKPQAKSPNLFVAAGQKARDTRRVKKLGKQVKAHEVSGTTVRGMVPEGPGEVVRASRRRQAFDQRKQVAGTASRGHIRLKNQQDQEVRGGIEKERRVLRKATPKEHRQTVADAEQLALEGHLNFDNPAQTRDLLVARRNQIIRNRGKDQVPKSRKGTNDDLARVNRVLAALDANPGSVLSPALREFHGKQVERAGRLRANEQIIDDLTSDVRRYMPLARTTGDASHLEHQIHRIEEKHAAGDFGEGDAAAAKAQGLVDRARSQFVVKMKAKTAELGVSEPVYVLHRPRPTAGFSDYAAGGSRAVAGPKKTSYKLFDKGVQDVTPAAYTQGVAKTIKRNVNWNTVSDILERHAAPWSRGKVGGGRRLESLRAELDRRGLDERDWAVVDMGVYRKELEASKELRGDDLHLSGEAGLHDALQKSTYDLKGAEAHFARTNRRFVVVPRATANELRDMTKPAGTTRRSIQKVQGFQSRVLLNLNPTFVPIQTIANTPLAMFAMRGNVKDLVTAQKWYHDLDQSSKNAVSEFLGISPMRSAGQSPRMGAASPDNRLVRGYRGLVDSDRAQSVKGSPFNPMNYNPMMDDAQNSFFRKAVFYNEMKRQAGRHMGKAAASIENDAAPLMDILRMPAGEEKIRALRQAEPQFEKIAEHVDDWLGNYLRYTARERAYLKTALLFYGFLRWSAKFTFYTMPVKHPIMSAVLAKLGQLHNEEVIDILSMEAVKQGANREDAERVLRSGAFADAFGRVWITSDGKLQSIDLTRVNPFTSPVADALGGGPRAIPGLLSPALQAAFDVAYGRNAFQDRPLYVGGKAAQHASDITGGQALRYGVRTLGRTAFPIRAADNILNAGTQSDDSLPILGDRPRTYTSAKAQAGEAQRLAKKGSAGNRALDAVLPLRAKPDNTAIGVAIRAESSSSKPKSSGSQPVGISDAELNQLIQEQQSTSPDVSDAEIQQLLREAGAR